MMLVELRDHYGKEVAGRGRQVKLDQQRIFVDGRAVGFIGNRAENKPLLVERFPDHEIAEIERQVQAIRGGDLVEAKQKPDVPEEIMNPVEPEGADFDDFDEE